MKAVEVEGLAKLYGQIRAVDDITFSIEVGEVVAILGPNGAGKTTTVEMLEGFRRPDAGHITVLGKDPGDRRNGWLDRIGIVLQQSGIEDELTVVESIAAQARPYTAPMTVEEVIAAVGLEAKKDERIKNLSGGQRRRLDLALGIVGNPELLFLDEPTTGFDPEARRRSWEVIRGLATNGTTIVLTTHYLEEAQELADRVMVMADGRIVADGSPDQIGERSAGGSTITFTIDPADASTLGVEPAGGGRVTIETEDPVRIINQLTSAALGNGIELRQLEVSRLTLEEAYLRLVGGHG
ncbi:MAG: ABC transporter ATP-binding protein [Acidimicrobiia bacterium]|jgi:ABC-2 type transport system ATP-binding protein